METALSVIRGDDLYYFVFKDNETVTVGGEEERFRFFVPDMKSSLKIIISDGNPVVNISKNNKSWEMQGKPDIPMLVDEEDDITICFSRYIKIRNDERIYLPESCVVDFGREARAGTSGKNNNIVIKKPFISNRKAHLTIEREYGQTIVRDNGSMYGTFINGKRIKEAVLKNGDILSILTVRIEIFNNYLYFENAADISTDISSHFESIVSDPGADNNLIERAPRLMRDAPKGTIEISAPPAVPTRPEINWLSTILPTIVTIGIAVVMTVAFNNTMMLLYTLPMTLSGVIVTVVNYLKQNKKFSEQTDVREDRYSDYIDDIIKQIERKHMEQMDSMLLNDPPLNECVDIVIEKRSQLWERRPSDADFANVRIGSGTVDFSAKLLCPREYLSPDSEDKLSSKPKEIVDKYSKISNAPIICDLYKDNVCGIIGKSENAEKLIRNMVVGLTTNHCYSELKIICIDDSKEKFEWMGSLPHFWSEDRKKSYTASTKSEAEELFKEFTEIFRQRKFSAESNRSYGSAPVFLPYYLFLILEPSFLDKTNPINEFLFRRKGLGVGCIMTVQSFSQLPKECVKTIRLNGSKGELFRNNNADEKTKFVLDDISDEDVNRFSSKMSLYYCREGLSRSTFPKNYSFWQMLGISDISGYDIQKSWASSDTNSSISAPIGITESGETVSLDLIEYAQGPHGLVAGTSGSGKSELLLSYILSLAMKYHPYDLGFLIIDFKGGGMASQLSGLPHLIGSITDIDGDELERSLLSVEAELDRRKVLFKEYNDTHYDKISDIYGYTTLYKAGKVQVPLPRLVIVIDEFAELKAAQPEFMKRVMEVSRTGRSLGVHLILATQNPSGQVDDQIKSNTKFWICLKVRTASESKEVIGSELASRITEPGRAYIKAESAFELIQSGYSGVKTMNSAGRETTQIRETVSFISDYCKANDIRKLPDICLPPLEKIVAYPEGGSRDSEYGCIALGIYDDPPKQLQAEYFPDVFSKNTFILGSQGTGKTNVLQTVIRNIGDIYSPEEVNIYIIDFNSMVLKGFESMNHVGGVVTQLEDEKLKNLFKLLHYEIARRKEAFLKIGVSSLSSYRDAGKTDIPQIILFIDNFTALREMYLQEEDPLLYICQNGLSYGISVIMTNTQTSGVNYKYLANFSNRIALYCNDPMEYMSLLDRCRLRLKDITGRCIISGDNTYYICQTYLAFDGEREIDRAEAIKDYISEVNLRYGNREAVKIPFVPETVYPEDIISKYWSIAEKPYAFIAGIDYDTVGPCVLDMRNAGAIMISGEDKLGMGAFIPYMIRIMEKYQSATAEFYIMDSIDRRLKEVRNLSNIKSYTFLPNQAPVIITEAASVLGKRYEALLNGDVDILDREPVLILVISGKETLDAIHGDTSALNAFRDIIGKYKNMNVCIIFGQMDNANIGYDAPEIVKKVKDDKKLFFFDDLTDIKIADVQFPMKKKYSKKLSRGDCYYICGSECRKIKTPELQ